jgi:hypothetical protein
MITSVKFELFLVEIAITFLKLIAFHSFFLLSSCKTLPQKIINVLFEVTCVNFVILDFLPSRGFFFNFVK